MSGIDIGIIVTLILNALFGLRKGFVRIVFDMLALGVGFFVGIQHYSEVSTFISYYLPLKSTYVSLVSIGLLWISVFVVLGVTGRIVNRLVMYSGFSLFNRFGGLFLGVVKGVFMAVPIIISVLFFNPQAVDQSIFLSPFKVPIQSLMDARVAPLKDILTASSNSMTD
jgi:uncharacterized membrane protein required for colicin V production